MKEPAVVVGRSRRLYPRLAITVQPPCTRLVFEDSTGEAVVDLLVGVEDVNRLLDVLCEEEFLDQWAEERSWIPQWIEDAEADEAVAALDEELRRAHGPGGYIEGKGDAGQD